LGYVATLEGGRARPSSDTVKALAKALGVSCSAFERNDTFTGEPKRTLARLADIAGQAKREGREYVYKGQTIPVTIYNWVQLIAAYGPLARPYAKTLIRLQEELGELERFLSCWSSRRRRNHGLPSAMLAQDRRQTDRTRGQT
jgi:hypothetical protein